MKSLYPTLVFPLNLIFLKASRMILNQASWYLSRLSIINNTFQTYTFMFPLLEINDHRMNCKILHLVVHTKALMFSFRWNLGLSMDKNMSCNREVYCWIIFALLKELQTFPKHKELILPTKRNTLSVYQAWKWLRSIESHEEIKCQKWNLKALKHSHVSS